ncbi:RluA family pseudouridine synthase [Mycoplasma leonicaptivi]|uniref:RluA family pseudouridine synthase n=1 Tax=Mycoplasma leonicaptivi TaxID=36742 RepID=UPI00047F6FCD|nr:RluA family pseudouridine synthase [Mycoplasma leonicaptivi]
MFEITTTKNDEGRTLYKLLLKYLSNLSASRIEKIFRKKDIKIDGKRINDKQYKITQGQKIVIYGVFDVQKEVEFKNINYSDLQIIYEDENILIINKKNGIEVHGDENSLDNQVLSYLKYKKIDSFKPSHVGRLDKETSGLIVYAKNYSTLVELNEKNKFFIKKYIFKSDIELFEDLKQEIILYFNKDTTTGKIKASTKKTEGSKYSKTYLYKEGNDKIAQIETGRKHQIRLVLKYLQKPIYGDKKYGGKKDSRLMLHSYYLKFNNLNKDLEYLNKLEFWTQKPKW